jgi:hypothetical protein
MQSLSSALTGAWRGSKRLFLSWSPTPEHRSDSTVLVREVARGRFLEVLYTWSHEGRPHEGILLVGYDPDKQVATGAWGDSWHQSSAVMALTGTLESERGINLRGSYSVPEGPDWGWRICFQPVSQEEALLLMFNITPTGEEESAVRLELRRA